MIEEENRVAGRYKIKAIWRYAAKHLRSWFPNLPSYQAFNARLNRLSSVFPLLAERFLAGVDQEVAAEVSLIDSLPIILCSSKRKAKVAKQLSDKGYCAGHPVLLKICTTMG